MEKIVCIDPGTRNTGVVVMDRERVFEAYRFGYNASLGQDQESLLMRAEEVCSRVEAVLDACPHDAVVIEGFTHMASRSTTIFQTPVLIGYLARMLHERGEKVVVQTSAEVLHPTRKGSCAWVKDRCVLDQMESILPGAKLCTNDHTRSALAHGVWYFEHRPRA